MSEAQELEAMAVVQADIEDARHQLQETVDELADRLNPKKRADEARVALEEAAQRAASQLGDVSKRAVAQLHQVRRMSPEEAVETMRQWGRRLQELAADERARRRIGGAAAVVLLLLVRHRRQRRRC